MLGEVKGEKAIYPAAVMQFPNHQKDCLMTGNGMSKK